MTAAVPLVERLTEVLAAHKGYEWWPMTREFICTCEASIGRDYPDPAHRAHLARALLPVVEQAAAEAEQRGREDNADHGMCYVHGSRALEARIAEAWDEGYLRGTLDTTSDLEPADNPYRGDATTEGKP